jgi:glyoxylase-like metal-dependent hydrolase (beta-lactamase superfamily II)
MQQILAGIYRYTDTCNVYVLKDGDQAVLIDFGSGDVLDALAEIGVSTVAAVLMTHHHRDQGQGLARAVTAGIPVYVPHAEQDLFHSIDHRWHGRDLSNNYNTRQDRFSLLEPVPVAGTLRDYQSWQQGCFTLQILPTPGHTPGSISLVLEWEGQLLAFCGDLLYGAGKIWSHAATQWTYNGAEGIPATILSLLDLKERQVILLLPSHGEPTPGVPAAVDLTVERLMRLLRIRGYEKDLLLLRARPYNLVIPNLLVHRCSAANAYVLISASGKAMLIDAGYDIISGSIAGTDRAARRPWLYTLPVIKRDFGVTCVDVVMPTHYHDDHVAGMNLLRDVEGAQTWAAESFAGILEDPNAYDLPCLWYDPIPVDRRLPVGQAFQWEEYSLTLYPLPGHTRYAVAILVEMDGKRVLFTGDQYQREDGLELNYVFQNRYNIGDYSTTARLYQQLSPDLILSGHWKPMWVKPGYLDSIVQQAEQFEQVMRELLPEDPSLGAEGVAARIFPYQVTGCVGDPLTFEVEVTSPFQEAVEAQLRIVAPAGWQVEGPHNFLVDRVGSGAFRVTPPAGAAAYRARIAVDVSLGGQPFGQLAEALVTLLEPTVPVGSS